MSSSESEEDDFPYKRYTMDNPEVYFKRAQRYRPLYQILRTSLATQDEGRGLIGQHQLLSKTSRRDLLRHFPLTFPTQGEPRGGPRHVVLVITLRPTDYDQINILPDYFTEDARVRDEGAGATESPHEYWLKHRDQIRKQGATRRLQRDLVWKGVKEARQGKITTYLGLFGLLKSRVVLDPSAAWGDRLIAALSAPGVKAYTGVDPHRGLPTGWERILKQFGPMSGKNTKDFVMISKPFEPPSTVIPRLGEYDTVLISPPPFEGDRYDIGNPEQAREHCQTYRDYIMKFLMPYLEKSIRALRSGGYLCMSVLDRQQLNEYMITELQLLLVELMNSTEPQKPQMDYIGVIFWKGDKGGLVPWWVFMKRSAMHSADLRAQRIMEAKELLMPYKSELGDPDGDLMGALHTVR